MKTAEEFLRSKGYDPDEEVMLPRSGGATTKLKYLLDGYRKQITKEIKKVIDEVYETHPYKKAGDRDSYSEYNEGWTDACDIIESKIESLTREENNERNS